MERITQDDVAAMPAGMAGGFQRSVLALTWPADSEFAGMRVEVRRASLATMLVVRAMDTSDNASIQQGMRVLAESLVSWNLLHPVSGHPLPTTYEGGVLELDLDQYLAITEEWMAAMKQVRGKQAEDLGKGSPNGGPPPEVFEQMALSSASPSS